MDKLSLDRLIDGLIDAYVDWRVACDRVNGAYRSWAPAMGPGDRAAFELYMTALDAEEHAAEQYAALVRRTYNRLWGETPPAQPGYEPAREAGSS